MVTVLLALVFAQAPQCSPQATTLMNAAAERATLFDLAGAAQRLQSAVMSGCREAVVPSAYLRGVIAAREAYRFGGSPESLTPVLETIAILESASTGTNDLPIIAAFVLKAAAAAAQSERDDLSFMIEHAMQLEGAMRFAGRPGLPLVTSYEVAGDLWLQVHRYDDARKAYERARNRVGDTPRVTLGLARVAARLDAVATACTQYRRLVTYWKSRPENPPEITEARAYLSGPACAEASKAR